MSAPPPPSGSRHDRAVRAVPRRRRRVRPRPRHLYTVPVFSNNHYRKLLPPPLPHAARPSTWRIGALCKERGSGCIRVPHPVLIGHACPAAEDASSHRANDHPCSCSVPPASVGSLRGRAPQVRGRRGRRGAPAARAAPAPPRHARACERARRRRRGAPPHPKERKDARPPFPNRDRIPVPAHTQKHS